MSHVEKNLAFAFTIIVHVTGCEY